MRFLRHPRLKAWLHFMRLPNQILLWICVVVFSGYPFSRATWLVGLSYSLMLFVANAWNDWLDVAADQLNRPGTNPFQRWSRGQWVPWILGGGMFIAFLLGLGAYGHLLGSQLWGWYVWLSLIPGLWAYSKWWQHKWLWKNVSASLLTALGVLSLGWMVQGESFSIPIFWLVWIANFWREVVKDLQDANGDLVHKSGNITRFLKPWHCQAMLIGSVLMGCFLMILFLPELSLAQSILFIAPIVGFLIAVVGGHWTWASRFLKGWMAVGLLILA